VKLNRGRTQWKETILGEAFAKRNGFPAFSFPAIRFFAIGAGDV
jgi:hypothetical protein